MWFIKVFGGNFGRELANDKLKFVSKFHGMGARSFEINWILSDFCVGVYGVREACVF